MACRHAQLVYMDGERAFTELSQSLSTNAPNLWKCWSTVKTAVFGVSSSLLLLTDRGGRLSGQQSRRLYCFRCNFTLNSAGITFSNRILVTILQYYVLLPFGLALFVVCFRI